MPYKVTKTSGSRPYKIKNKNTGKTVGTSTSRKNAKASIRARHAGKQRRA